MLSQYLLIFEFDGKVQITTLVQPCPERILVSYIFHSKDTWLSENYQEEEETKGREFQKIIMKMANMKRATRNL